MAEHDARTPDGRLRRWLEQHERAAVAAWLGGCALVLLVLGAWGIGANGAERLVDASDTAWVRELDGLSARVRARDFEAALPALERLERKSPAVFVKHRFDREQERLLGLLARCYVELDRRKLARETLQRLVAFDPRNYDNHFRLAQAERAFGDELAAGAAYDAVLAIHPTHLPSVQARIEMAFAAGAHEDVIGAYERYLDAWLLALVVVRLGERAVTLEGLVDGRAHVVEAALEPPAPWSGLVCVETGGFGAQVDALEFEGPRSAGAPPFAPIVVTPDASWIAAGGASPAPGALAAADADARLCGAAAAPEGGAARVRLTITLYKSLPEPLWELVGRSYRNRLATDAFESARTRSRTGGWPAAGSSFAD